MSSDAKIQALVSLFEANGLDCLVMLRMVEDPGAMLQLWPYAVMPDAAWRHATFPGSGGEPRREPPDFPQRMHVLIMPATLDAYDRAWRAVQANPLLGTAQSRTRVSLEPLPQADMTALFLAARVPYRLAISVVLDASL